MAENKTQSEPLFSKKNIGLLKDPLTDNNPVTVQVLGICSALAITAELKASVIMGLSVIFVLGAGNVVISLLRNLIPSSIRIIAQLVIAAALVILVDLTLKAYVPDLAKKLSVFVGLIITNCIVMGRLEAFALGNKPYDSILDGFGSALGYSWIILAVAFFRELFGSGSVFGVPVFDTVAGFIGDDFSFATNGLMVTPVGAFIILGLIIWVQRTKTGYVEH